LLGAVPGSVLWLLEGHPKAVANLRREAQARGIDPARLIFAGPRPLEAHLGRLRAADLFLDTAPYNAHTSASDALWAGVPVVSCPGESFASRVAGSLLNALGMPELVAASPAAYENLAAELAADAQKLASIRAKIARNAATHPLFDAPRFAKNLERAYEKMQQTYRSGALPGLIEVTG
jgi:predicted O-linked N-acetylglucosamine transferase (SPINDLY family)